MTPTTLKQIADRVQGELDKSGDALVTEVGIDSRALTDGQLFIAIKGDRFDGHDFIDQGQLESQAAKAGAVIVSRPVRTSLPQILVKDTRLALGDLAREYRKTFTGRLVSVTGSNGKTSVKEMIASICERKGKTLATFGNLNNDYGLPLTILQLSDEDYAVIEMGANHHGEISYLTSIAQPEVAVITNAGSAHLEGFGSIAGVAKAKGEIFEGLQADGTAVINLDDQYHQVWLDLTKDFKRFTFGVKSKADFRADYKMTDQGADITMHTPAGDTQFNLQLLGVHNVMNALAAAAVTSAIDIDLDAIAAGLGAMRAVKGRLQWKQGIKNIRLLDDTYNANPTSLGAALNVLAVIPGEHWVILGDMGELGEGAVEMHEEAGRLARRAGIERLLTFGTNSRYASDYFGEGGKHFTQVEDLVDTVRREWTGTGAILVKGSRAMQMERFVHALEDTDNNNQPQTDKGGS